MKRLGALFRYSLLSQLGPEYPTAHSHMCSLTPLKQLPPLLHGLGEQLSMSIEKQVRVQVYSFRILILLHIDEANMEES